MTTPPGLTLLSPQQKADMGFPPGESEIVVDQWGNVVIPLHPPGSFGLGGETGQWQTEDHDEWPPDSWPPGTEGGTEPDEEPPEMTAEGMDEPEELADDAGGDEAATVGAAPAAEEAEPRGEASPESPESPADRLARGEAAGAKGAELTEVAMSVVGVDAEALYTTLEPPAAMERGTPDEAVEAIPITVPMPPPPEAPADLGEADLIGEGIGLREEPDFGLESESGLEMERTETEEESEEPGRAG